MLPDDIDALPDLASVHSFVAENFLTRHQDELQQLKSERRPGRPPHKRELQLNETIANEQQEYSQGFDIPDLTSLTNVKLLRDWQGDPQALPLFRMVRISAKYPYVQTPMPFTLHLRQQQNAGVPAQAQQVSSVQDCLFVGRPFH